MEILEMWWLSLAIFAAVVVVVAVLLGLIVAAAKKIDQHAAGIWTVGKQIADNTVPNWMLDQANRRLSLIAGSLDAVEKNAKGMDESLQHLAESGGVRR